MTSTRACSDDFQILTKLGAGSFGIVFKVRRYADDKEYVVKEIRIAELTSREQLSAVNEVKLLAKIKSPYVVKYYDYYIDKESLHIVMEYCNRGDLSSLIRKAKEKPSRDLPGLKYEIIWSVVLQIILGLQYLHSEKILHRDLKSANVFLHSKNDTFQVKIGDLGVAKLLDTSTAFAQTIVGTPYYLSPELCADMPYRDKSDCWALGVILYECCVLKHPFDARHQCALIMKIIQSPVPPLPTDIPDELARLTMWLLAKDPHHRPSINDILCEKRIRDKLVEYRFPLPEELLAASMTGKLSSVLTSASSATTTRKQRPPIPPSTSQAARVVQGNRVRAGHPLARRSPSSKAMQRHQVVSAQFEYKSSDPPEEKDADDEETAVTRRVYEDPYEDPPPYSDDRGDDEEYPEDFEEDDEGRTTAENEFTVNANSLYYEDTADPGMFREGEGVSWSIKNVEDSLHSSASGSSRFEDDEKQSEDVPVEPAKQPSELTAIKKLIKETKARCQDSLGDSLFGRLYGLCAAHVTRPLNLQSEQTMRENERVVKELGDVLQEHLLAGADVAYDAVRKVKVLLAMESEFNKLQHDADDAEALSQI